jgi:hypothetical protein
LTAPAAVDWSDTITLMRAKSKRLSKRINADQTIEDYDSAYFYDGRAIQVAGLLDVAALLRRLLPQPHTCVVRGALRAGVAANGIRRLVHAEKKTGDQPTLEDASRRWLAIDADDATRPQETPATDLLACAEPIIDRLPRPFRRAACIVQASGSHGIKPGSRLRLWYWCDRPMSGAELKFWLKEAGVDRSVFNAAQPIYTAAPVFADGRRDHLPDRLIEWPGEDWLRCPSRAELVPPPRPVPEYVAPVCASGSARARLYIDAAREKAAERIRTATMRHPTILQEACGLARFVNAGLMTKSELQELLWTAAQGAGKDDEAEITRMVSFGLDHPGTSPIPLEVMNG